MRKLLETLLIVLAIGLCGIVLLQWKREFDLRRERQAFADRLSKEEQTSHGLRASLQRVEAEVIRLTDLKAELASTNQAVRKIFPITGASNGDVGLRREDWHGTALRAPKRPPILFEVVQCGCTSLRRLVTNAIPDVLSRDTAGKDAAPSPVIG
jgi:hypothetical protein